MCLKPYANNKGADQPAQPRSLISTFVVCCLDSMIFILVISKVSRFYLASVAEQADLNVTWLKISEDTFFHDVTHYCDLSVVSSCTSLRNNWVFVLRVLLRNFVYLWNFAWLQVCTPKYHSFVRHLKQITQHDHFCMTHSVNLTKQSHK